MLLIARMTATSVPWYITSQEAMTTMVDCDKEARDGATQQPTIYFCRIAGEWAMIANAQSARDEIHRKDDNIVDVMINSLLLVVSQKASTTTKSFSVERKKRRLRLIATTERARLHKRQPTLWSMWINHINNCKGAKRQQ
jgi:hypothetical protein